MPMLPIMTHTQPTRITFSVVLSEVFVIIVSYLVWGIIHRYLTRAPCQYRSNYYDCEYMPHEFPTEHVVERIADCVSLCHIKLAFFIGGSSFHGHVECVWTATVHNLLTGSTEGFSAHCAFTIRACTIVFHEFAHIASLAMPMHISIAKQNGPTA